AAAVGTDGVELVPQASRDPQGRWLLQTADEALPAAVDLTNLTPEPRRVRLYAVSAVPLAGGGAQLGGSGSADWLGLPDQVVDLAPQTRRTVTFTFDPSRLPAGGGSPLHAAYVLETRQGDTLVTRAASVVRVGPPDQPAARWPWLLLAGALLVMVASGHARVRSARPARRLPHRAGAVTAVAHPQV
ncbi:MAG TPA: hypothetical protein VG452_03550, partial [Egibacteraceae bacterium]|nr:hypothetical protein [Egibacteraceae bacterium]